MSITVVPTASRAALTIERLGELDDVGDVAERLVRLHHRELGVVRRVHPLVAERPSDLEHPVQATDDQALEVQLGGDAQVQRHVQRVVVGHERAGVGAAGLDVEDRRLDLDEAAIAQRRAEARQHGVADLEDPTAVGVDDEVGVALAVADVGVGEAVPLVRQRADRLGQQLETRHLDGDLAGAGRHHGALRADPVAAIERLDVGERVVADDRLGDEQLEVVAAVGDGEEDELSGVALEHDTTADRRPPMSVSSPGSEVGAERAHVGGAVGAVEAVGIGLAAGGPQLVDLPLATGALGGEPAARRSPTCLPRRTRSRRPTVPGRFR